MNTLPSLASRLRELHFAGEPLVLANVWDAASAKVVAGVGYPVIATSSAAIAQSLGIGDHEQMPPADAFAAVGRIANAVEEPVTADLEAGYGLPPEELVDRLLDARAVGCNLEDSRYRGSASLVDAERQCDYIAGVNSAARAAGVEIVINARVDVYMRDTVSPAQRRHEAVRRGRMYLNAGATCVYPIGVTDKADIAHLVDEIDGPLNIWLRTGAPSLATLRALGVARVSLAGGLLHHALAGVAAHAAALLGPQGNAGSEA